jgi:hypothetical protein
VSPRGGDSLQEKPGQQIGQASGDQPKLTPWEDDIFKTPTPKEMMTHCCKSFERSLERYDIGYGGHWRHDYYSTWFNLNTV